MSENQSAPNRDPDFLRPLLRLKYEIQKFNLELMGLPHHLRLQYHLILSLLFGSNFSLWRFAFTLHKGKSNDTSAQAMEQMILQLADDNTMSFTREVENSAWYGAYCANNSIYRLQRLIEALNDQSIKPAFDGLDLNVETFLEHVLNFQRPGGEATATEALALLDYLLKVQLSLYETAKNLIHEQT